jgi:hypothetical protein
MNLFDERRGGRTQSLGSAMCRRSDRLQRHAHHKVGQSRLLATCEPACRALCQVGLDLCNPHMYLSPETLPS